MEDIYQRIRSADTSLQKEYIAKYKANRRKEIVFFSNIFIAYAIFAIFSAESFRLVDIIDKIVQDITTVFTFLKVIFVFISLIFVFVASLYVGLKTSELADGAANGPPIWHKREFSSTAISLGFFVGLITYGVLFVGFTQGLGIDLLQYIQK